MGIGAFWTAIGKVIVDGEKSHTRCPIKHKPPVGIEQSSNIYSSTTHWCCVKLLRGYCSPASQVPCDAVRSRRQHTLYRKRPSSSRIGLIYPQAHYVTTFERSCAASKSFVESSYVCAASWVWDKTFISHISPRQLYDLYVVEGDLTRLCRVRVAVCHVWVMCMRWYVWYVGLTDMYVSSRALVVL